MERSGFGAWLLCGITSNAVGEKELLLSKFGSAATLGSMIKTCVILFCGNLTKSGKKANGYE